MTDEKQLIQNDDYAFPYHYYIPQFKSGYSHTYSWPWGVYYISAMEFLLKKRRLLSPKSIADIGTGDGRFVCELVTSLSTRLIKER